MDDYLYTDLDGDYEVWPVPGCDCEDCLAELDFAAWEAEVTR